MRINQVAEIWLTLYRAEQRSEATTANEYQRILDNVINPAIGSIRLREATAGRLERLIRSQETHSRRKKTKTVLKMMLDAAVIDDAIPANPVSSTSRLRGHRTEVQALSMEDLDAVRSAVDAWMTKKRSGPKSSSDMPDIIDLLPPPDAVSGKYSRSAGQTSTCPRRPRRSRSAGRSRWRPARAPTGNPSPSPRLRKRTLALAPFAVAVLLRRRVEQPPNQFNAVFATRNGTWHQVGNIERRWRTIRADAGLDWVTPHTFRKTVATIIDRLVDSDTAARVLGHSSAVITKEYYIEKDRSAPDVTHLLQSFADRNPARPSTD